MELTSEQYEQIRTLIEDELRAASRAALDGGATVADVEAGLAARRRALGESALGLAEDPQDAPDQSVTGGGVAEQL